MKFQKRTDFTPPLSNKKPKNNFIYNRVPWRIHRATLTWRDRNQNSYLLEQMDTNHIINALRFVNRHNRYTTWAPFNCHQWAEIFTIELKYRRAHEI